MSLEADAESIRAEYDDLYGDDAYVQLSINYVRFMREWQSVERAKKDRYDRGLCYSFLRMRPPNPLPRKKSDKKAI